MAWSVKIVFVQILTCSFVVVQSTRVPGICLNTDTFTVVQNYCVREDELPATLCERTAAICITAQEVLEMWTNLRPAFSSKSSCQVLSYCTGSDESVLRASDGRVSGVVVMTHLRCSMVDLSVTAHRVQVDPCLRSRDTSVRVSVSLSNAPCAALRCARGCA